MGTGNSRVGYRLLRITYDTVVLAFNQPMLIKGASGEVAADRSRPGKFELKIKDNDRPSAATNEQHDFFNALCSEIGRRHADMSLIRLQATSMHTLEIVHSPVIDKQVLPKLGEAVRSAAGSRHLDFYDVDGESGY